MCDSRNLPDQVNDPRLTKIASRLRRLDQGSMDPGCVGFAAAHELAVGLSQSRCPGRGPILAPRRMKGGDYFNAAS